MEQVRYHLPSLEKLRAPHDFLEHIAWRSRSVATSVNIDLGLAHYLTGNVAKAADILQKTVRMVEAQEPKWRGPHAELAMFLRDQLEMNPDGLRTIIDGWRDQNVEKLNLSASCANRQLTWVKRARS